MHVFGRESKNFVLSIKHYALHDNVLYPRRRRTCGTFNPEASTPVVTDANCIIGRPWRVSQVLVSIGTTICQPRDSNIP